MCLSLSLRVFRVTKYVPMQIRIHLFTILVCIHTHIHVDAYFLIMRTNIDK